TRVQTPRFCGEACRAGTVLRALSGCRGLAINWLIVGIFAFATFGLGIRERNSPQRPSFNLGRTITLVRVVLGLWPGIVVRGSAHVTLRDFPTRKTKSRHPPTAAGRSSVRTDALRLSPAAVHSQSLTGAVRGSV